MAVVVGTAQGKLTLDASKFIANIDSSYKALKKFNDLTGDTQKALNDLPNKTIDLGLTGTSSGAIGTNAFNIPDINVDPNGTIPQATQNVGLLSKALGTGLTASLNAVGTLAQVTFDAFLNYTKEIINFSKESLQVGMQFDATMSQVSAISGAMGEDFDALREKAIEMGAQTKFSASEAAQAMVYMGMAGWDTEQIYDGLAGVMSLAAASGEDLATTSDIVTDALTAFGLGAKDAAHFSDVLAAASTNSNTNVALMGETFKYVAPLAGTMGYSIEDAAVAIGLMANSGIKGSQAGTALRNIISNLADPPKQAAAAMEKLGITLTHADGSSKDFMGVMQDLRAAFADISNDKNMLLYTASMEDLNKQYEQGVVSEEEYLEQSNAIAAQFLKSVDTVKAGLASDLAGKYGLSGLLAIVNSSDEDFQKLTESIYAASDGMGAAASMEEKMMDNLQGSTTVFKSTLETFQITVSDILKGSANDVVNFGQQALSRMTTALKSGGVAELTKEIGKIIPEAANMIVQYIPEVLPFLIDGFWTLVNGFIDALPEAMPIIVEGAVTLFMGLTTGLTDAVKNLTDKLPDILEPIMKAIEDDGPAMLDAAVKLFLALIQGIIKAAPDIIKAVAILGKDIIQVILNNLPEIINTGIDLILALLEGLTDPDTIKALIEAVGQIGQGILDALDDIEWLELCDKIFSGIGEALLGVFEGALSYIDELLGTDFAGWAREVGNFFSYLKQQSAQFGWDLAQQMNKTEIELNELGEKYDSARTDFLRTTAELIKEGISAQEAMAAAYQKYFTTAEAQYYFKERMAKDYIGEGGTFAGQLGSQNMSAEDLIRMLTETQVTTGNTYNFYSPQVIDEKAAAEEIRKVNEEILMG